MTVRRVKSYTGQTGYVYQYYFVGNRPVSGATEYVYDVTSDRKTIFPVSILLHDDAVAGWAAAHGRELSSTERYAATKMRLFQAFDEIEKMKDKGRRLDIDADNIEDLLGQLNLG